LSGQAGPITEVLEIVGAYQEGRATAEDSGELTADMLDAIRWSNAFAPQVPVS